MSANWQTIRVMLLYMANRKIEPRLPPIMHAYLEDLAKLGAYGQGKSGVARRFIEDGIKKAIENKVIQTRTADDFENDGNDA